MEREELANLYGETKVAADVLHAKATEVLQLAERLERLTEDTPARYAGTRARVEARIVLVRRAFTWCQ
jgi:hypothetical protein